MSQRRFRRRAPVTVGKRRRRTFLPARRFSEPRKASKLLNRCSSEPTLKTMISSEDLSLGSDGNGVFYRPQTCYESFPSSLSIMDCCPPNQNAHSGYSREAKVVVKVEVEGSPGPVRMMVKLGSSINDTIKLVIHKYDEERRTPKIHLQASSSFELHSSYFSLQSLDKSTAIGDVGSRNFYLRRSNKEMPVMSYPPQPTSSTGIFRQQEDLALYNKFIDGKYQRPEVDCMLWIFEKYGEANKGRPFNANKLVMKLSTTRFRRAINFNGFWHS